MQVIRWPLLIAGLAVLAACGGEPKIEVQSASGGDAGAESTPTPAAAAPGVQAAHEPVAQGAPTELPPDHPPIDASGGFELAPVDPAAGQGQSGMSWKTPGNWVVEPPSNSMRRAQYKVPGDAGDGECVVFYFGPGQGGSAQANAERWASQFEPADGRSPLEAMSTRTLDVGGIQVLVVETRGTYHSGSMMGGPATEQKENWALLGAVVEGADSNWFFKFTGPQPTVEANREAFETMLKSVSRGG